MKKYELKIVFHDAYFSLGLMPACYILKRRRLGIFWSTEKRFYNDYMNEESLEDTKEKALNYMNDYCQIIKARKESKKINKEYNKERYNWIKSQTVYKTCECKEYESNNK